MLEDFLFCAIVFLVASKRASLPISRKKREEIVRCNIQVSFFPFNSASSTLILSFLAFRAWSLSLHEIRVYWREGSLMMYLKL